MLRSSVINSGLNWERCLPLVEIVYDNSYHASFKMSPFEALYGRICRTHTCWMELSERKLVGPELV